MENIQIVEIGPRDGYQSVDIDCGMIPTDIKEKYIDKVIQAGIKSVQYSSFVSPKAIPQLADAKELSKRIIDKYPDIELFALVPNLRGAKDAYEHGVRKIAYVVSYSKTHNKKNINRSHEESFEAFQEIKEAYPDLKIEVNFATAFACPFEGKYRDVDKLVNFMRPYIENGVKSAVLCDTIGMADPNQVRTFIKEIRNEFPQLELGVHFHDTRGLGMSNTLVAIDEGVKKIETALGGLGGCPFAPGASGNLATEDLVWALEEMSYNTGIDSTALIEASKEQRKDVAGNYSGHHMNIEK